MAHIFTFCFLIIDVVTCVRSSTRKAKTQVEEHEQEMELELQHMASLVAQGVCDPQKEFLIDYLEFFFPHPREVKQFL